MFRRRKSSPLPPLPVREPDLVLDGRPLWIVIPSRVTYSDSRSYDEGRSLKVLDPYART